MSNQLDTKVIGKLAEILDKNNLTEIEYEDEGCRICITRDLHPAPTPMPMAHMMAPAPMAAPAPVNVSVACEAPQASATAGTDYSKHAGAIKSPMVGVVYMSAEPGAPDYVKVGDTIKEGDTVCLIEAMKTFNPVKSTKAGKVTQILVTSGDPVEYGEPLVIVE